MQTQSQANRTVLLRRKQSHGDLNTLVRATVLSEKNGMLRVVPENSSTPIEVKASEALEAPAVFGTRNMMQRGIVVQRAIPDSGHSLVNMLAGR